jgi:tRNA(Ile)-lysidine synthase TilS/MesJ
VQQRYLDRLSEISGRIMPKTRTVDEVTIIRPVLLIDEPEFDEYIEFKKLPVVDTPCRFKMTRPKRLLFDLVRQSNYQFNYDSLLRVYASFGMIPNRSENSLESWMNLIL